MADLHQAAICRAMELANSCRPVRSLSRAIAEDGRLFAAVLVIIVASAASPASSQGYGKVPVAKLALGSGKDVTHGPAVDALCVVDDSRRAIPYYRTENHGNVLGTLDDGKSVSILNTAIDTHGKSWVYVADNDGNALGWVFRSGIFCLGER